MPYYWSLRRTPKLPVSNIPDVLPPTPPGCFLDERGSLVDLNAAEPNEQRLSRKYIEPDNVVLELGARYGTVSYAINSNLAVKTNHVAVEPDWTVWKCLEQNLIANGCGTHIVKGFISREKIGLSFSGYGTSFSRSHDAAFWPDCFTLEEIENKHNLTFDTLVADCEGGLEIFLDENPKLYNTLKFIMFEEDAPTKCDYNKIRRNLTANGFVEIEVTNGQNIWKKYV